MCEVGDFPEAAFGDAYAAGLFDGEGCIEITSIYTMRAKITMSTREPLDLLCQEYGGSVMGPYVRPNKRDVWTWQIAARKAAGFLRAVYPFLIVKKEQAHIALDFQALMRQRLGRGDCVNEVEKGDRHVWREALLYEKERV